MSKFKINKVTLYAANLIAVQLVFALADMYVKQHRNMLYLGT